MRLSGSGSYSRPTPVPRMPVGLVELMEGLTKDVLKHNPTDVYEFCANHMQKLLVLRDGPSRFKTLTIDQKIKTAQDKIKKRSEQQWRNYKQLIYKANAHKIYLSESVNSAVDKDVSQKILIPVHHEHALKDAVELEIACGPGEDKIDADEHSNDKEKTQEVDSKKCEVTDSTISKYEPSEVKPDILEQSSKSITKEHVQINKGLVNVLKQPKEEVTDNSTHISDIKEIVVDHKFKNNDESTLFNNDISIDVNHGNEEVKLEEKDELHMSVVTYATNNVTNQLEQLHNVEHSLNINENKETNFFRDNIDTETTAKDNIINEHAQTDVAFKNVADEVITADKAKLEISETISGENIKPENTIGTVNVNQAVDEVAADRKDLTDSINKYNSIDQENKSGVEIYVTQSDKLSMEGSDDCENSYNIKEANDLKTNDEVIASNTHGLLNVPNDISNQHNQEQNDKNMTNSDSSEQNPLNNHKSVVGIAHKEEQIVENSQRPVTENKGKIINQTCINVKQNEEKTVEIKKNLSDVEDLFSNIENEELSFEINQVSEEVSNIVDDLTPKGDNSDKSDLIKPQVINNNEKELEIVLEENVHLKPVLNMVDIVLNLQNIQEPITETPNDKDNILPQINEVQEVNPTTEIILQNQPENSKVLSNSDLADVDKFNSTTKVSEKEVSQNTSELSESSSGQEPKITTNIEQTELTSVIKDDMDEISRIKRDVQYHDDIHALGVFEVSSAKDNDVHPNVDDSANEDSSSNSIVEGIIIESSDETGQNDSGNTMDLETAAVTIQKVFRTFLFKSRASTFEDSANDENNLSDDDNDEDKDERAFLPSTLNKDRRTLGISRMDTVLQTVNEEKSLSLSTDDSSLSSAATIIQAHVRGFLVRNKLHSGRTVSSTNSLINSDGPSIKSLEADAEVNKNKTILNIHIVPEGNNFLSRDESMLASMDLSLDGSPPSSINLHPLGYDKSERRKQLKREDAIQSVSPPSNNSGKLSDDAECVKELPSNNGSLRNESLEHDTVTTPLLTDDSNQETKIESIDTTPTNSITVETVIENTLSNVDMSSSPEPAMETLDKTKKSLTKQSSDEMDVVTPFKEFSSLESESTPRLLHSGEFHDTVLPTKVSRSNTSVVSGE